MRFDLPFPTFGEALESSPAPHVLAFLARRRSASAMTLAEPAPSSDQLRDLLTLAARVPDHGKLAPWRFVVLSGDDKAAFVSALESIARRRDDADILLTKLGKLRAPPLCVAVISQHNPGKIAEWEQRLSAGAVCGQLLNAAQAMGFGGNWITDWYAYDPEALRILGLGEQEQVAGFIQLGTPNEPPRERVRPNVNSLVTYWKA